MTSVPETAGGGKVSTDGGATAVCPVPAGVTLFHGL
jgi:hypothetical protein